MKTHTAVNNFLNDCAARRLSTATQDRYKQDLKRLCTFLYNNHNNTEIETITTDTLRSFLKQLHETRSKREKSKPEKERPALSPFTIEGIFRSISTFFHWCHQEGIINYNPMSRLRRPKLPKRIIPRLSEEKVAELLQAINNTKEPERNLAIVLLMVDSGLRRGEITNLQLHNIKEGFIQVIGKGNKERQIPIGQTTQSALNKWIKGRPRTKTKNLFTTPTGNPLHADAIRSLFMRLRHKLNLTRLYPHLLRHTFANLYLKRGDLKSLSQILGHSKISTTADIYVEFDIEDLIEKHRHASPIDHIKHTIKRA